MFLFPICTRYICSFRLDEQQVLMSFYAPSDQIVRETKCVVLGGNKFYPIE